LRPVAETFGIPYHVYPITLDNKDEQGRRQVQLLKEQLDVDIVVLARYMQVLTDAFLEAFPSAIINIHQSFLPAFSGSRPYHAAFERGVKLIGATAHYTTAELDQGPIIEQVNGTAVAFSKRSVRKILTMIPCCFLL
jgi:formyltetrahydrofolate deformylase